MTTPTIRMRRWTTVTGSRRNSPVTSLHVCATIALICADGSHAGSTGGISPAGSMRQGGGALEFAEDGFFVGKKVTNEAISVLLMHCQ